MDGIDAALLETDGTPALLKELGDISIDYDASFKILLKAAEYALRKYRGDLAQAKMHYPEALKTYLSSEFKYSNKEIENQLHNLSHYLQNDISLDSVIQHSTELHAQAVQHLLKETGYTAKQIDVVGYHGQTLYHQPEQKISIIVGDGQALADQLGIRVVNDFRSDDIAAGGQGAPFAPLYHQALAIRDHKIPALVVNCGGIANVSLINTAQELDLVAFDTGPGNGLIDRLVRQRTAGKESMDKDGRYGQRGQLNPEVLQALYAKAIVKDQQNYFSMKPPKSLDSGDLHLIPELEALSLEDACRTLEFFTADSIVKSVEALDSTIPLLWVLAGGGWNNPVIESTLKQRVLERWGDQAVVVNANALAWNSQAMEAQVFAYLAVRSLHNKVLSVPGTTRVSTPSSGGRTYIPTAVV